MADREAGELVSQAEADALLDEIGALTVIGSARGGKKPTVPVTVNIVRALTPEDLPLLLAPPPVAAPGARILQIRHTHHLLARAIAEGKDMTEAGLITGYSNSYISILKTDPAFAELLEYYSLQREQVFIDVAERMKALGLNTIEELGQRLEEEPEKWTKRELMELAELTLLKGRAGPGSNAGAGPGGTGGAGGGVSINVKFVSAGSTAPMVDITPEAKPHG